jgi:hypothetical protein
MSNRKPLVIAAVVAVVLAIAAGVTMLVNPGGARPQSVMPTFAVRSAKMGLVASGAPPMAYGEAGGAATDAMIAPIPPVPEPTGGQTAAEVDQKIIKNGSLEMVVDDVAASAARVTDAAVRRHGFVQGSTVTERADGTHQGYVTVRVPVAEYDAAMAEFRGFAKTVKNESSNGQDVTEQYTDLQAQLRNAQAQEEQYLAILKQAKSVDDILAVQERLGTIRGTIESLQGRIKYLENVTAYSTISVTLEEEPRVQVPTKEFRPVTVFKEAVRALVAAFEGIAKSLIWAVIVGGGLLLPLVLLALLVWAIVRRARRGAK